MIPALFPDFELMSPLGGWERVVQSQGNTPGFAPSLWPVHGARGARMCFSHG